MIARFGRRSAVRGHDLAASAILVAIVLLGYVTTAAPSITWSRGSADSGDITAAVATAGIPHPPGYPLFVTVGYALTRIVPAEPARIVTMLDAALIATALGIVCWAALQTGARRRPAAIFAAVGATLAVGAGSLLWNLATFPNAHAPNVAFAALAIATAMTDPTGPRTARRDLGLGLLLGAAMSHHLTLAVLVFILPVPRRGLVWVAGAIAGLSPWLLLPILAARVPAHAWGDVATFGGFLDHIVARQYHEYFASQGITQVLSRAVVGARSLVVDGLGPIGSVLVAIAVASAGRSTQMLALRWAAMTLTILAFFSLYAARDVGSYVSISVITAVPLIAAGLSAVADRSNGRIVAVVVGGLIAAQVAMTFPVVDRRRDTEARDFARVALSSAPDSAILVTDNDARTFALWYGQVGLGLRPDITIVDRSLWPLAWYRRRVLPEYRGQVADAAAVELQTGRRTLIVDDVGIAR